MPRTPTTPAQVSGHRFLVRQVQHALVRADARMLHDPLRTRARAQAAGAVLLALLAAGSLVLGLFRPAAGAADDAAVLLVRGTGAIHVRLDGRVHPAANLASARLALGRAEAPARIPATALGRWPAGPAIGIPGAPDVPAGDPGPTPAAAGVCDLAATGAGEDAPRLRRTLVRLGPAGRAAPAGSAALAFDGRRHWLLAEGSRARVDPADPVLARALGLGAAEVRPVSPALLRALPERAPVALPEVGRLGAPTGRAAPFDRVGAVVRVDGRSLVAVAAGAAEVDPVPAAALAAVAGVAEADARALARVPVAPRVDRGSLPATIPDWLPAAGWLCAGAAGADGAAVRLRAPAAGRLRPEAAVALPGADGPGPAVDGYLGPAATVAAVTGAGIQLISGTGIRHRVAGPAAAAALGYPGPGPLPWAMLAGLPEGPELSGPAARATG